MSKLISKIVVPDSTSGTGYSLYNVKDSDAVHSSDVGVASGVASLDSSGKVPSSQLPSYVDDVIEGYYHENKFYTTYTPGEQEEDPGTYSGEITAETGKIYVDIPTNQSYRWSGSAYIVISSPYVLPTASANTLGGVKVGSNLSIDQNGVLSSTDTTYSAGSGIDISNGEISVDSTVALKTDLANEKNGNGIGTCSTSSGTALVVSLTGYELVQNGFVAVSFEHDVPASATLNINGKGAKPIIYKDSAITADTIKADDTALFSYDGTNYVLISSGSNGAASLKETVIINLSQQNGSDSDLIGTAIEVTDSFTSDTLLSTTWQGTDVSLDIDSTTVYTVTVGSITGYLTPASQSYKALPTYTREVDFVYNNSLGIYIEATDGSLYTSSRWANAGKSANAIVVLSTNKNFRIAPLAPVELSYNSSNGAGSSDVYSSAQAEQRFDGLTDTNTLAQTYNTSGYAANYARSYSFLYGNKQSYIPAAGQLILMYNNWTAIKNCYTAIGVNVNASFQDSGSSTRVTNSVYYKMWCLSNNGNLRESHLSGGGLIYPCCDYD